jgi:predicted N-formylglutamate amidohydrolase
MLLAETDPHPVEVINPQGASPFLLIGDHAGNRVPTRLADLGLPLSERERHIGWDIGVASLGERLATSLDAIFVRQVYSRLVIDCNRDLDAHDLIAPVSDGTTVPGNRNLSDDDRAARIADIHAPYHQAIAAELRRRQAGGVETVMVALHSFTPRMGGVDRPWQIGVLHDRGDTRFAHAFMDALRADGTLTVGDNEPYRMDGIDYTIPRHAYPDRLPYAELEVRQDLLLDAAGVDRFAVLIAGALGVARAG